MRLVIADRARIAKPELLYPEAETAKSMRPTGSSDLQNTSKNRANSGFAGMARLAAPRGTNHAA
jgi:hypothetical protein